MTSIPARGAATMALAFALLLPAAGPARATRLKSVTTPARVEVPVERAGPFDSKVDPALRLMVSRWNASQRLGVSAARTAAEQPLFDQHAIFHLQREPDAAEPVVSALVKLTDPSATSVLEGEGARVSTLVGDIAVARVPVSRVMALAEHAEVRCMQMSGMSYADLDSSRARSHVNEVHAGTGLDRAYQGAGVVVGVLDSGLDYTHPDFQTAGGASRLKGLFDFSSGANGQEWSVGSIDSSTCTEYDGHGAGGHGTHVTGTAAGGGQLNPAYLGIAPLADIVFVKGTRDTTSSLGFADADVVAGVQFIFDKARALDEPAVVNLSLGGQFGAHDGTSLYEQALDGLTHPGNLIVAAAGNSAQGFIHAGYSVPPGTTYAEAAETAWFLLGGQAVVDAWYPASGNIRFGLAVYAPGNYTTALAGTAPVTLGSLVNQQTITDGSTNYGLVTIDATTTADPNNGKRRVVFVVNNAPSSPPASSYRWSIYAVGNGTFDMWNVTGGAFPPATFFGGLPSYFVEGNNDKSVGMPATAKKVISVGSYVTKTQWLDVNNVLESQPGATMGEISTFSSHGPSGDGRTMPDLAAPGEAIVAPMAVTVQAFTAASDIAQGGGYLKEQGTSMASPHVTGTVALMLERNRFLTPENVRALLKATAAAPGSPDPNIWGGGKLNALAAMQATPASITCGGPAPSAAHAEGCQEDLAQEPATLRVHPNPTASAATIAFRLSTPERVDLAMYDLGGRRVRVLSSGSMTVGTHELVWDGTDDRGRKVPNGVYFTRLRTPSRTALERLVVVQ